MRQLIWSLVIALFGSACSSESVALTTSTTPTTSVTSTTKPVVSSPAVSLLTTEREAWDLMLGDCLSAVSPEVE